jgi:hypothetical protein
MVTDCGIRRREDVSAQAAPARFGDSTRGAQARKKTIQRLWRLSTSARNWRFIQPDRIAPQPDSPWLGFRRRRKLSLEHLEQEVCLLDGNQAVLRMQPKDF